MIFPKYLKVFGDTSFRGACPKEDAELATFFNQLRKMHPNDIGVIALHPKNEGKRTSNQISSDRMKGLAKGASDIIIVGNPSLVIEMKRRDHTKSSWEVGQKEFLEAAYNNGSFVCVCLGYVAALEALDYWVKEINKPRNKTLI